MPAQTHYPERRKARLIFAAHWALVAGASLVALLLFPQLAAASRQDLSFLRPYLLPMALAALLCAAWYCYSAQSYYLSTSPAGLRYRAGGCVQEAPWDSVLRIERRWRPPGASIEGLVLQEPGVLRCRWWALRRRPADFIPLVDFPGWRAGALGRELRRYRTQLLAPGSQPAGPGG